MKNGRSYTKMCKDLFCVELKKKHFLIKWMVTYKNGKKSQRGGEITLSHRTCQDRGWATERFRVY